MIVTPEKLLSLYPGLDQDVADVDSWFRGEAVELDLRWESMSLHAAVATELLATYPDFPKDATRTRRIVSLLRNGETARPIFVDDSDGFILEGRHRIVAFHRLRLKNIPVVHVKKVVPVMKAEVHDDEVPRPAFG